MAQGAPGIPCFVVGTVHSTNGKLPTVLSSTSHRPTAKDSTKGSVAMRSTAPGRCGVRCEGADDVIRK